MAYQNNEEYKLAEKDFLKLKELLPDDESVQATWNNFVYKRGNHQKNVGGLFKSVFRNDLYNDQKLVVKEKWIPTDVNPDNPKVFFYIRVGTKSGRRVEIELFKDRLPITAENFRSLCTGESNTESFQFHYKNTPFYHIDKGNFVAGGDIENKDGTGGYSIYGRNFEDEHFIYPHSQAGVVSMLNNGKDTNNSKFIITLKSISTFDEKYIVVGRVVVGMDVIWEINELGTDMNGKPYLDAMIEECGEILQEEVD